MAEWARHNVQVNAICPTVIMTPMGKTVWGPEEKGGPMRRAIPLRRFGEPVEVADLALYLASPAAELVNGALVMIEGGFSSV
jgi:NAD(P)-dependent dehydrogenase (short-subunit alcohol dehydrogenase family)